jgi:hypothetical protein
MVQSHTCKWQQPDLVIALEDEAGSVHLTRAFNMETSKQLNAQLNGFEPQMRQMTDYNYNFFMHAIMLIYQDAVDARIVQKGLELPQESDSGTDNDENREGMAAEGVKNGLAQL